jgi:hypothetical protein
MMGGHQRVLNDLWMILIWLFHYPLPLPSVNSTSSRLATVHTVKLRKRGGRGGGGGGGAKSYDGESARPSINHSIFSGGHSKPTGVKKTNFDF